MVTSGWGRRGRWPRRRRRAAAPGALRRSDGRGALRPVHRLTWTRRRSRTAEQVKRGATSVTGGESSFRFDNASRAFRDAVIGLPPRRMPAITARRRRIMRAATMGPVRSLLARLSLYERCITRHRRIDFARHLRQRQSCPAPSWWALHEMLPVHALLYGRPPPPPQPTTSPSTPPTPARPTGRRGWSSDNPTDNLTAIGVNGTACPQRADEDHRAVRRVANDIIQYQATSTIPGPTRRVTIRSR